MVPADTQSIVHRRQNSVGNAGQYTRALAGAPTLSNSRYEQDKRPSGWLNTRSACSRSHSLSACRLCLSLLPDQHNLLSKRSSETAARQAALKTALRLWGIFMKQLQVDKMLGALWRYFFQTERRNRRITYANIWGGGIRLCGEACKFC